MIKINYPSKHDCCIACHTKDNILNFEVGVENVNQPVITLCGDCLTQMYQEFFEHKKPLNKFTIPDSMYESSITPERNKQGIIILPKNFDDDEE